MPISEKPEGRRYREALERTSAGEDFSAEGVRRLMERTVVLDEVEGSPFRYLEKTQREESGERTRTASSGDPASLQTGSEIPRDLIDDPGESPERFAVDGLIGKGAVGRVFSLRDRSLNRVVAMKLLGESRGKAADKREKFIHEARVTASLEHPNILPVYDIGVTGSNQVFFTMKKVGGCTLGDAIRSTVAGEAVAPEPATADDLVRVLLKLCDALSFAHSRGYIHQDVKPDNVMVGEFGEVLLLDWGSSSASGDAVGRSAGGPIGTPAYMSPEQARREWADERSDIYCLGATFFHALMHRHPTWADEPEEFWEKKRKGIVDLPGSEERRKAPARLIDIALKALNADPALRYRSATEFAEDLKRYQNGMAISAHRDSLFEAASRWYRGNRRVFWVVTAAVLVVGIVAQVLFREKLKEMVTWRLLWFEDFGSIGSQDLERHWVATYAPDWATVHVVPAGDTSHWHVIDGALVGRNRQGFDNLTYRSSLTGNMRIEWEVRSLRANLNLNCFIGGRTRRLGYTIHVGGWNMPDYVVLTKAAHEIGGGTEPILEYAILPRPIESNRTYRFRMEKEGRDLRFCIDGRRVLHYTDYDVLRGPGHQSFGFECSGGNEIGIDNVKVYHQPLPQRISPLAVADAFFARGLFADARAGYAEINEAYPTEDIGKVALYKIALCEERSGAREPALRRYAEFERLNQGHGLVPMSMYRRARILSDMHGAGAGDSLHRALAERFPGHSILRSLFFDMSDTAAREMRIVSRGGGRPQSDVDSAVMAKAAEIRSWADVFAIRLERNPAHQAAASYFYGSKRYSLVLREFPEQRELCARALLRLDRQEEVIVGYRDRRTERATALRETGQFERVLREYPEIRSECSAALLALQREAEVLERYPDVRYSCARSLVNLGRFEEVVSDYRDQTHPCRAALANLGRQCEYPETVPWHRQMADVLIACGRADEILVMRPRDTLACALALIALGRPGEVLERYPDDGDNVHTALMAMGRFEEALDRAGPGDLDRRIEALIALGRFDQALDETRGYTLAHAAALRDMGRYDEVLELCADAPEERCEALLAMGRYEVVLAEHTSARAACGDALLALGRYREVLERYRDSDQDCVQACWLLGDTARALLEYPFVQRHRDLMRLKQGRFDRLTGAFGVSRAMQAEAAILQGRLGEIEKLFPEEFRAVWRANDLRGLELWARGRYLDAESAFRVGRRFSFDASDALCRFGRLLMPGVLRKLRNPDYDLTREYRPILDTLRFAFRQILWHEAAYLAGELDEEGFRAQPHRDLLGARLVMLKAIRADFATDTASALAGYHEWDTTHTLLKDEDLVSEGFVTWRMGELSTPRR